MAISDRLFGEFDDLPVIDITRAITHARHELRSAGVIPAPPELVAARARALLDADAGVLG